MKPTVWVAIGSLAAIAAAQFIQLPNAPIATAGDDRAVLSPRPSTAPASISVVPPATLPSQSPVVAVAAKDGDRQPHSPPKPGEIREMTIPQLGNFEYDQDAGGDIPPDVKRLSGMTVHLSGFMVLLNQSEQVTRFMLVPYRITCLYCQAPSIQQMVFVDCPPGKPISFTDGPIIVQGVLSAGETKQDGYVVSLFNVAASNVEPAKMP